LHLLMKADSLLQAHRPDALGDEIGLINPGGSEAFPTSVLAVLEENAAGYVSVRVNLVTASPDAHHETVIHRRPPCPVR
jgi:hypothetical protein